MVSENKLSKEGIGFILCNCLSKIIDLFVSTFLVAYLLGITNGNILQVSLYYMFLYLGMLVFYTVFSHFLHRISKLVFYRTSIALRCVFLVTVALLKENVVNYIIPIAVFYGIEQSLYWSSYNVMMTEAISSKNIQKFYGTYNIFGYITSIVAPLVLGSIIDAGSFIKTAIYAFIVCLLLFFSTFLLVSRKEEGKDLRIREFCEGMKENTKHFKTCYLMCFFTGLRNSLGTLVTILIVLTFNSNLSLGSLSSFMSIMGILITIVFTKKYTQKHSKIVLFCFMICLSGFLCVIFDINKTTVVLFNALHTTSMLIPDNLYSQRRMGLVRVTGNHKFVLEHNVLCEASLNIGRVISYVALVIAAFAKSTSVYKILLIIHIFTTLIFSIVIYLLEKRYAYIISKNDTMKHLKEVENDCVNYYVYKDKLSREII